VLVFVALKDQWFIGGSKMTGAEMLMKSFGIDPKEVMEGVKGTVEAIKHFDRRLQAIEERQAELTAAIIELTKVVLNGNRSDGGGVLTIDSTGSDSTRSSGNGST
jgi:hypothetical protein